MSDAIGAMTRRMAQSGALGAGGVGGIRPLDSGAQTVPALGGEGGTGGVSFGDTLKRFVNDVSASQVAASDLQQKFLRGEPVELHQMMAAGEEAGIALELMVELRNKVTEAYRTLINMQA
jgi:flagellar hook-basal body complex protein FliE